MTQRPVAPRIERIDHVSIRVTDWEQSLRFYGDVLGLECTIDARLPDGRRLVRFAGGEGSEIELISRDLAPGPTGGSIAHIALAVRDVEQALQAIEIEGFAATRSSTKLDIEGLRATIAFFAGPNGESFELICAARPQDDP